MTNAYTIPVAFLVEGVNEEAAAKRLIDILAAARLTQDHRSKPSQESLLIGEAIARRRPGGLTGSQGEGIVIGLREAKELVDVIDDRDDLGPIQSWWMPNHPITDRPDSVEQVLVFAPTGEHRSKAPHEGQRVADLACNEGAKDPGPIGTVNDPGFTAAPSFLIGIVVGVVALLVLGGIVQALQECAR